MSQNKHRHSQKKSRHKKSKKHFKRSPQNTLKGQLRAHRDGYGFVIPLETGEIDVFVPPHSMGEALPDDTVVVSYQTDERGRRDGRIIEVVKRGRDRWTGIFNKKGKHSSVVNQDFGLKIDVNDFHGAKNGEVVVAEIDWKASRDRLRGSVVEVLGDANSEKVEVATILANHGIDLEFPVSVLSEAKTFGDKISHHDHKGRVDLRGTPLITIDGIKARDFDDAVFAEKKGSDTRLIVAIADVAEYVKPDSSLDREAIRRGTSVYLPDFAVPMLPENLSNNLCSLKPNEDRLALVCEIVFASNGNVKSASYYEAVFRSAYRCTYEEVQSFLDGDSEITYSPQVKTSIKTLAALAHTLIKNRIKRGAINFDLPEPEIIYDHKGEIESIRHASRFFSHKLIEECMIAANVAVAELMGKTAVPILYRVHDKPDPNKLQDFATLAHNLGVKVQGLKLETPKDISDLLKKIENHPAESLMHQVLLRSMKQAVYTPENRGHYGLALKNYAHFTSPIRRYPDLLVHRQLKSLIRLSKEGMIHLPSKEKIKKPQQSPVKNWLKMGEQTSLREREAMETEREVFAYKQASFMLKHIGEKFAGQVKRVTKFGVFVELTPHAVEGLYHVREMKDDFYIFNDKKMEFFGRRHHKKIRVGDTIDVVVSDVSLAKREIYLAKPED